MHTSDHKREREEREGEGERARRDWGAHGDFMDLLIDGVTVGKVGHIDCGKHLAGWQYHMSTVN